MTVTKKSIYQFTIPTPYAVGNVHVYLLTGDVLSLVDAGVNTDEAWDALENQLQEQGFFPQDIEQIILTHHHPDHTGLIERFRGVKQIIGHKNNAPWLNRDEAYFNHYDTYFRKTFRLHGIPRQFNPYLEKLGAPLTFSGRGELTDIIEDGDVLPGHPEWKVLETKGHAQSHVSFLREDGMFIGGDHLLEHISPNPIMEPPLIGETERPKPLLQYRENIDKCLQLGISKVLPGHGRTFSNVEEIASKQRAKQEARAKRVLGLLKDYSQTPFQLCEQIFPRQYKSQLDLTMSETIGQLDYLESIGLVSKTIEDGVLIYHAN